VVAWVDAYFILTPQVMSDVAMIDAGHEGREWNDKTRLIADIGILKKDSKDISDIGIFDKDVDDDDNVVAGRYCTFTCGAIYNCLMGCGKTHAEYQACINYIYFFD
jgi:hypothetical protein